MRIKIYDDDGKTLKDLNIPLEFTADNDVAADDIHTLIEAQWKIQDPGKLLVKNNSGAEFDCTEIEDLWHIAEWVRSHSSYVPQANAIIDVWHKAHAMRDHIKRERGVE